MNRGVIAAICLSCALHAAGSAVVVSDDFESYSPGTLDKNLSGTTNAAPNGSGNPWWGPSGGRLVASSVVGTTGGVTPHSGTKMVAGAAANGQQSTLWDNIAYRSDGGQAFAGNLTMTFWFYDPNGATNGVNFAGYGGVAYYNTNSTTADYPSSQTLNTATTVDRLSLGGASFTTNTSGRPQTYDSTKYQARVVGTPLGYTSNGWIDLPLTRAVGWHEGQIVVGPAAANGTDPVSFYIDDLATPLLTTSTVIGQGYDTLEFSSGPDASSSATNAGAYFDDVTVTVTPEPASLALLPAAGFALLCVRRLRKKT